MWGWGVGSRVLGSSPAPHSDSGRRWHGSSLVPGARPLGSRSRWTVDGVGASGADIPPPHHPPVPHRQSLRSCSGCQATRVPHRGATREEIGRQDARGRGFGRPWKSGGVSGKFSSGSGGGEGGGELEAERHTRAGAGATPGGLEPRPPRSSPVPKLRTPAGARRQKCGGF